MHAQRGHGRQQAMRSAQHERGVHAPHTLYRPAYRTMHRPLHARRRARHWSLWSLGRVNLFVWLLPPMLAVLGIILWRAAFNLAI